MSAPAIQRGTLWFENSTNLLRRWSGTRWQVIAGRAALEALLGLSKTPESPKSRGKRR